MKLLLITCIAIAFASCVESQEHFMRGYHWVNDSTLRYIGRRAHPDVHILLKEKDPRGYTSYVFTMGKDTLGLDYETDSEFVRDLNK